MGANTYTEDDFKQILKNLFAEKKRVKELQQQLEEKGIQKKFQAKLADIHKLSLTEEYAKLKAAYLEKEKESEHLKKQLEKVRPALKKLVEDLKSAQGEIATLKTLESPKNESFKEAFEEANQKIKTLEEQKQCLEAENKRVSKDEGEILSLQRHVLQLEEELESIRKKNKSFEDNSQTCDLKIEALNKLLEEERAEVARAKADEQKEVQRFESERGRLVERLADSLSQVQRQTEMIKDLREDFTAAQKKIEENKQREKGAEQEAMQLKSELAKLTFELSQVGKISEYQLSLIKEEKAALHAKNVKLEQDVAIARQDLEIKDADHKKLQLELDATKEKLQGSDLVALTNQYEAKLAEIIAERDQAKDEMATIQSNCASALLQKEEAQEEILERSYVKMRELSDRYALLMQEKEVLQKKLEEQEKSLCKFDKEQASLQNAVKNAKLQCEERDAEIRKAQQHLAKKVKETTILRDLVERQKTQLNELQALCDKQKNEAERMQNSLNLQRMHEEKLQAMSKERTQAAETLTKEWQEKFLSLQEDWQDKKAQLIELQKMRKTYDQMATTFSSLKNILGNALEHPSTEDSQNSGN